MDWKDPDAPNSDAASAPDTTPRGRVSSGSREPVETSTLARERNAFERDLPGLLRTHEGQVAVYFGDTRIGVFSTRAEALRAGYQLLPWNVPFLVQSIEGSAAGDESTWRMGRPL